jgi:hypothetical protein
MNYLFYAYHPEYFSTILYENEYLKMKSGSQPFDSVLAIITLFEKYLKSEEYRSEPRHFNLKRTYTTSNTQHIQLSRSSVVMCVIARQY